jgi:hypothetical protein
MCIYICIYIYREAKMSDNAALDHWQNEAKDAEENVKRLQRGMSSKDALIRDLKTRLDLTMGIYFMDVLVYILARSLLMYIHKCWHLCTYTYSYI